MMMRKICTTSYNVNELIDWWDIFIHVENVTNIKWWKNFTRALIFYLYICLIYSMLRSTTKAQLHPRKKRDREKRLNFFRKSPNPTRRPFHKIQLTHMHTQRKTAETMIYYIYFWNVCVLLWHKRRNADVVKLCPPLLYYNKVTGLLLLWIETKTYI